MKKRTMDRRKALRGAGSVLIALPLLEAMLDGNGEALAQTGAAPKKCFGILFCGQSTTKDNDAAALSTFVPAAFGGGYTPTPAFAPLALHGDVRANVSLVSHLKIPWTAAGAAPAGGWTGLFHVAAKAPLLCASTEYTTSADQLVAAALSGSDAFKSLQFCAQASWYLNGDDYYGRDVISYSNGSRLPQQHSPRAAFQALFGTFVPPDGGSATANAKAQTELTRRRSILDLVLGERDRVLKDLGAGDKIRLEKHFEEVRALERRLAAAPPTTTATCSKPSDPGADPAVTGGLDEGGFDVNAGYSQEFERARTFCDLIHMAFACDMTHAATMMITTFQSHMLAHAIDPAIRADVHEIGHLSDATTAHLRKVIAWHVDHFAYLVDRLRATPEGANTLLDRTVLVFKQEGGAGVSPENTRAPSTHSTENMAMLVAGGALSGLKLGQHIDGKQAHPGSVLLAAAQAVAGAGAIPAFGAISQPLAALKA